jgi:hypothetical protein
MIFLSVWLEMRAVVRVKCLHLVHDTNHVRFEVLAVTMKNGVFWDVFLRNVRRLLVTANADPSSPILVTLMMEALSSTETSVLT